MYQLVCGTIAKKILNNCKHACFLMQTNIINIEVGVDNVMIFIIIMINYVILCLSEHIALLGQNLSIFVFFLFLA